MGGLDFEVCLEKGRVLYVPEYLGFELRIQAQGSLLIQFHVKCSVSPRPHFFLNPSTRHAPPRPSFLIRFYTPPRSAF
jgi:hypothetical protein